MIIKAAIVLLLLLTQLGCSVASDLPEAKVAVKAVDESGKPIEGVKVAIGFLSRQGVAGQIKEIAERGLTSREGVFSASKRTTEHIAFSVENEGYYKSNGEYYFKQHENGRWLPWGLMVPLVLRKIIDPVPMFARDTQMSPLPPLVTGKEVGFDLTEYDWVAPYGKGRSPDFLVEMTIRYNSQEDYDYRLSIKFPNKFDGIQVVKEDLKSGSDFKLLRHAPETGYQRELIRYIRKSPGLPIEENYDQNTSYIFRIRAEEKDGHLVRAIYGKIQGDIRLSIRGTNTVSMLLRYYVNPSYSTNLEYDPNKNLFTGLESFENVGM